MATRSDTDSMGKADFLSHEIINRALFTFDHERSAKQLRQKNARLARQVVIRTAQLNVSNAKLLQSRQLSAHLHEALEEERTRISREIHDQLGQALTGLKFDVAYLKDRLNADPIDRQQLKDKATAVMAMLDDTLETVRNIASDLRPGSLDDLGLVAALEWQAQAFQTRTGVRSEVVCTVSDIPLPPRVATGLFRMTQEALTNVARHAQATQVHVVLIQEDVSLTLEVQDNGRGISESEKRASKSLGLLGLSERALLLGGTANVTGAPGKGTTVTIRIPMDSNSSNSSNSSDRSPW